MRVLRELGLVLVGCSAMTALAIPPAYADSGFAGSWTATDVIDGSSITLSIHGAGPRYSAREVDAAASVCDGAPASLSGGGKAEGDVLEIRMTLQCLPGGNIFRGQFPFVFFYDAGTDTLTDGDGVLYSRAD